MREILFRGKRVDNGEWVEGYFVAYKGMKNESYIFEPSEVEKGLGLGGYLDCCKMTEVIPESVGHYTGLTDKNGTKIFEGDIVLRRKDRELVFYDGGGFSPFAIPGWECTPDADEVEVIGNIHDNPELCQKIKY